MDELDLPPAPPPLEDSKMNFDSSGYGEELPEFPELDEKISAPDSMPMFDFPEEEKMPDMGKYISGFPGFPGMEQDMPAPPNPAIAPVKEPAARPMPSITQQAQETGQISQDEVESVESYPKPAGKLFSHEKKSLRQHPNVKTIYVRVDNFKATLGNINILRGDLRKSEEVLNKLENIKNSKDKSFDKMRASLDDLQKKLIFIDKTLFKGE